MAISKPFPLKIKLMEKVFSSWCGIPRQHVDASQHISKSLSQTGVRSRDILRQNSEMGMWEHSLFLQIHKYCRRKCLLPFLLKQQLFELWGSPRWQLEKLESKQGLAAVPHCVTTRKTQSSSETVTGLSTPVTSGVCTYYNNDIVHYFDTCIKILSLFGGCFMPQIPKVNKCFTAVFWGLLVSTWD